MMEVKWKADETKRLHEEETKQSDCDVRLGLYTWLGEGRKV